MIFISFMSLMAHLLALAKGLCGKKLDKLNGHFIRVVRVAVNILLLQEVNLERHGSHILSRWVKVVDTHCKQHNRDKWRIRQQSLLKYTIDVSQGR